MRRRFLSIKKPNNRGASLAIALVLFLVCAMVGVVVISAGTSSVGRVTGLKEEEQAYLSTRSCASFLADLLEGKEVYYLLPDEENGSAGGYGGSLTDLSADYPQLEKALLNMMTVSTADGTSEITLSGSQDITFTINDGAGNNYQVDCSMVMDSSGNLVMELAPSASSGSNPISMNTNADHMRVSIPAVVTKNESDTIIFRLSFGQAEISQN